MTGPPTLPELLARTARRGGSDLHLTAGVPPQIRVNGALEAQAELGPLTPDDTRRLIYGSLTAAQRRRFEETLELDVSLGIEGVARVRANVFGQRGTVAAVYRLIPEVVRGLDELGLPPVVAELAARPHGLVLVTGPTGSGKSTTLAALVDRINAERRGHILTIEDPVEYVHSHRRSIVNQREVHQDTAGFAPALRAALREDPDVVLIGEMRDLETTEAALRIAETGHLTLATLHTSSAVHAVGRVIDLFPAHQQQQVRTQLSLVLEGVICQSLVPTADGGGRVCAAEVLMVTPAVRNLIREDKPHLIHAAMQAGRKQCGMQTMTQALAALYRQRRITLESARDHAANPEELESLIARGRDEPEWTPRQGRAR
jgi:twitching motility protein PilT